MSGMRLAVAAMCAAAVFGLAQPVQALAGGGWAWPVEGPVIAAYGARYTSSQGVSCTHGGIDIAAPQGTAVRACAAGEVVFSGQVPAGEGERSWAVTVLTADGLRVTYLPLRGASVAKGTEVRVGTALGDLAGAGDSSSSAPHLHLGVRRGETRLDPLSFLGERAAAAAPVRAPEAPHTTAGKAPREPHTTPSSAHAAAPYSARAPAHATGPSAERAAQTPSSLPHASLPGMPTLRRVQEAADLSAVRTAEVAADLQATRDFLGSLLVRLGLAGIAGACAWPVLRGLLDGHAGRAPAAVAVRRDGM
jgi:hypothetical protein